MRAPTPVVAALALALLSPVTRRAHAQAAPPRAPVAAPSLAMVDDPATYARAVVATRRFIRDTMRVLGAPGASITVMKDGRVIWSEGFGWADVEQQVPVTALTRFRIGSVSKPITAVALGALVQEGKIDLDAPVQRYVRDFPAKRWPFTVRQLAGHLAGIRHYRGEEFLSQRHYASVDAGLAIFRDDSLEAEPGTRWGYTSYGFNLLGAVIERAAGRPFLGYVHDRVLVPAGMRHTVAEYVDSLIPNRARFYTRTSDSGGVVNAPFVDNSYKWAGGGYLSTTEDLARFGQAMLDGVLLAPATVAQLWTSQRTRDGKLTDYGMGWGVERDAAGRRRISHGGGSVGGTAFLVIYPEQKLVVALLVNSDRTFTSATPRMAEEFLK